MKFFIILYLSLSLMSCIVGDTKDSAFRDRERTEPRARATNKNSSNEKPSSETQNEESSSEAQQKTQNNQQKNSQKNFNKNQAEDQNKTFIFPVEITDDLESLKIESSDNKRIHISAVGGDMFLLAPQTGSLSIKNLKDSYHLEISIPKERKLNLLLEKSKTILKVNSESQVTQRQFIAQTSGVAIFYISKDSKDLVLCLGDIQASVPIIKNLSIENCNQ